MDHQQQPRASLTTIEEHRSHHRTSTDVETCLRCCCFRFELRPLFVFRQMTEIDRGHERLICCLCISLLPACFRMREAQSQCRVMHHQLLHHRLQHTRFRTIV